MYFDFPERILMPKIKLKEGMRISLQNTLYDVIAIPSQGEVVISDVVSGEQQPINVEAVLAAYASGQLTVPLLKAQVNQRKQREHPLVGSNYDPPALTKTFRRLSAAPDKVGKPLDSNAPLSHYLDRCIFKAFSRICLHSSGNTGNSCPQDLLAQNSCSAYAT